MTKFCIDLLKSDRVQKKYIIQNTNSPLLQNTYTQRQIQISVGCGPRCLAVKIGCEQDWWENFQPLNWLNGFRKSKQIILWKCICYSRIHQGLKHITLQVLQRLFLFGLKNTSPAHPKSNHNIAVQIISPPCPFALLPFQVHPSLSSLSSSYYR